MNQHLPFGQKGNETQSAGYGFDPAPPGSYTPPGGYTPPGSYPPPENYAPPSPPAEVKQRKWVLPLLFFMFLIIAGVLGFQIMNLGEGGKHDPKGIAEACVHQWSEATCDLPQKCIKCNLEQGTPLGHLWMPATCQMPSLCERCGATSGNALAHTWAAADCEHARTCSQCGATEGEPNGHVWTVANCQVPRTCTVCGKSEGAAAGHDWLEATCERPRTCSICGTTEGVASGHDWKSATVTSPDTCSRCGATRGSKVSPSYIGDGYVQTKSGAVLNLRDEPSTSAGILTSIPQHTNITLYTSGRSDWYYTSYNGKSGYVSAEYVQFGYYDDDFYPFPGHSVYGYVKTKTGSSLNLRASASTSSRSLDLIPDGTYLELMSYENGWYYTYYNGNYGYVSADYIRT